MYGIRKRIISTLLVITLIFHNGGVTVFSSDISLDSNLLEKFSENVVVGTESTPIHQTTHIPIITEVGLEKATSTMETVDLSIYGVVDPEIRGSTPGSLGLGSNEYSYSFSGGTIFYNPIYIDPVTNEEYIVVTTKKQLQWINTNGKDIAITGTTAEVVFRWKKGPLGLLGSWEFESAQILDNGDMFETHTPQTLLEYNDESSSESTPPVTDGGSAGESTPPVTDGGSAGESTPPVTDDESAGESTPPVTDGGSAGESTPPVSDGGSAGESTPPVTDDESSSESTPPVTDDESSNESTPPVTDDESSSESTPPITDGGSAGESTPPVSDGGSAGESTPPVTDDESAGESTPPVTDDESAGESTPPVTDDESSGESTPPVTDDESSSESTPPITDDESSSESTPPVTDDESTGESTPPVTDDESSSESTPPVTDDESAGESTPPVIDGGSSGESIPPETDSAMADVILAEAKASGPITIIKEEQRRVNGVDKLFVRVGITSNKKYSQNENYLIANDIDMSDIVWTPWDYSGKHIQGSVVLTDGTKRNPIISNLSIEEGANTKAGVGFFGAICSPAAAKDIEKSTGSNRPWWDILGNLLGGITDLVGGLLSLVGGLASDLVGLITGWTEITSWNNRPVLIEGLTLSNVTLTTDGLFEKNSVLTPMPVGTFAGQASGAVTINNCNVLQASSVNGEQWVGGFIGKTVGATNYLLKGTTSGLNNTLGGLGSVVDGVLNVVIPNADLVGNLIDSLGVDKLIPTKYIPVQIIQCAVEFNSGGTITAEQNFGGGFAGRLEGTVVSDSRVANISNVQASTNVGGFAGRINNAHLIGLLQELGVNLVNFPVSSIVTDCTVAGDHLEVNSIATSVTAGEEKVLSYAGGFAGAVMASNIIYSGTSGNASGITEGLSSVRAKGHYVGGFTGYAGIGDIAEALNLLEETLDLELNADGSIKVPLGSGLTKLLDTVLGVNLNAGILSLIGIKPSQIVGGRIVGVAGGYSVISTDGDRVGGYVGFLYGGRITEKLVEQSYERVQATDAQGRPIYVNAASISKEIGSWPNKKVVLNGGIYARTAADGTIVYENIHGQAVTVGTITPNNNNTIYNIYDNVFVDLSDGEKAKTLSTFRDETWQVIVYPADHKDSPGSPVIILEDLPGYTNGLAFPVYMQKTDADGRVKFVYKYAGTNDKNEIVTIEIPLWRDTSGRYWKEDGTEFTGVNQNQLSVEALEAAVEDAMVDTGAGIAVATYLDGVGGISGGDFVGGIIGQAKLASAVDLLSNLTIAQYERFELNYVRMNGSVYGANIVASKNRAGGAIGYAVGGDITNVEVHGLASVSAKKYAGGFGGEIVPGTIAGEDGTGLKLLGLINVSNVLSVIDAVHTFVSESIVTGIDSGYSVTAKSPDKNSAAGGFIGWTINSHYTGCAVSKLKEVEADTYAGGFVAVADTGSIAGILNDTFGGIDLGRVLGLSNLLSLLDVFTNEFKNCNVNTSASEPSYTVKAVSFADANADGIRENAQERSNAIAGPAGSAGGFIGYGTAVQMDKCINENLKLVDSTSYAGGFGGFIDVGSVAQLGNAGIIGKLASVTGIATLLDTTVSMVLSSHCQGTSGGYTVTSQDKVTTVTGWDDIGIAGGFIGNLEGSHIEGSYANHLNKVIGKEYAGGFVGRFVPGDVTKAVDNLGLLDSIIQLDGGLLSALEVMVPTIKNSFAKCVPCGGVVEAMGLRYTTLTNLTEKTGIAGGFVGLNSGGQIWGNETKVIRTIYRKVNKEWGLVEIYPREVINRAALTGDYSGNATGNESNVYGTAQTCDILQLIKVDASQYAGGYSGYTVAAQLASLGDINLLGGLIPLNELLALGQLVVPTQRHTGVTGPLRNVNQAQMNYFNNKNQSMGNIADFSKYYGYMAGSADTITSGGYVGVMTTGVITDSVGFDLLSVDAIEASGSFVGAMLTGGVAEGDIKNSLLGGLIDGVTSSSDNLLGIANAIVPVIERSGMNGYYSGCKVTATNGSAGGYAGKVKGGKIWGEADTTPIAKPISNPTPSYGERTKHCYINNLRLVSASGELSDAGGFVGYLGSASVANLGGLGLLKLIELPANFISLLSVTVPTIYYADVDTVDSWGFRVIADHGRSAGGFAGFVQGGQIGVKDKITGFQTGTPNAPQSELANIFVNGLKTVRGGDYAGGCFGYADASDTLNVTAEDSGGTNKQFTLLSLISLGNISAIELSKSYIYNTKVTGIDDGYTVTTNNIYNWKDAQWDESKDKAACAGGFGGLLKSGVVRYSAGVNLSSVESKNYAGGFVGKMSKTSIIKLNDTSTTDQLLFLSSLIKDLGLGVGDVFGSHILNTEIWGTAQGYSVESNKGHHNIAGGFVGYAHVCRIKDSHAYNLRTVSSKEIAGGFMGAMSDSMLLNVNVGLLEKLLNVVVSLDLLKVNRSKIENASVNGVADWDGFDVYGGGSSETAMPQNNKGFAGSFIGLNLGSTIIEGNVQYADSVKGTLNLTQPYIGTAESTALLTNLEINTLDLLPSLKDWFSKSEIVGSQSTFETIRGTGNITLKPNKMVHAATTSIANIPMEHQVSSFEADLIKQDQINSLVVKKELAYTNGATPNIADMEHVFEVQLRKDDVLKRIDFLRSGESVTYPNLVAGIYTITENPVSVLPGHIQPFSPITVEVASTGEHRVIAKNTVIGNNHLNSAENTTLKNAAFDGKYVVNRLQTDDVEPPIILQPCEVLAELPSEPVGRTNREGGIPIEFPMEIATEPERRKE